MLKLRLEFSSEICAGFYSLKFFFNKHTFGMAGSICNRCHWIEVKEWILNLSEIKFIKRHFTFFCTVNFLNWWRLGINKSLYDISLQKQRLRDNLKHCFCLKLNLFSYGTGCTNMNDYKMELPRRFNTSWIDFILTGWQWNIKRFSWRIAPLF